MKSKIKICGWICLLGVSIFTSSIYASSTNTLVDVRHYIDQLSLVQNQIFSLAQGVVFPSDNTSTNLIDTSFNAIDKSLDTLSKNIERDIEKSNNQQLLRELRLLLNVINYMQNALFELKRVQGMSSPSEKLSTLENYYNFRVYAGNTLAFVEKLLLK